LARRNRCSPFEAVMSIAARPGHPWLRLAVFAIAGLEAAALAFFVGLGLQGLGSNEQLGRSISQALVIIYGLPLLVLVAPALLLAALNRWLPFAFALCTVGIIGAGAVAFVVSR
jgi:hypothetical protein